MESGQITILISRILVLWASREIKLPGKTLGQFMFKKCPEGECAPALPEFPQYCKKNPQTKNLQKTTDCQPVLHFSIHIKSSPSHPTHQWDL